MTMVNGSPHFDAAGHDLSPDRLIANCVAPHKTGAASMAHDARAKLGRTGTCQKKVFLDLEVTLPVQPTDRATRKPIMSERMNCVALMRAADRSMAALSCQLPPRTIRIALWPSREGLPSCGVRS